jgi:hypothetical protein
VLEAFPARAAGVVLTLAFDKPLRQALLTIFIEPVNGTYQEREFFFTIGRVRARYRSSVDQPQDPELRSERQANRRRHLPQWDADKPDRPRFRWSDEGRDRSRLCHFAVISTP